MTYINLIKKTTIFVLNKYYVFVKKFNIFNCNIKIMNTCLFMENINMNFVKIIKNNTIIMEENSISSIFSDFFITSVILKFILGVGDAKKKRKKNGEPFKNAFFSQPYKEVESRENAKITRLFLRNVSEGSALLTDF